MSIFFDSKNFLNSLEMFKFGLPVACFIDSKVCFLDCVGSETPNCLFVVEAEVGSNLIGFVLLLSFADGIWLNLLTSDNCLNLTLYSSEVCR